MTKIIKKEIHPLVYTFYKIFIITLIIIFLLGLLIL